MGTQQTLPPERTQFISMDNFYNGDWNSPQNIYQSRWSNSSSKNIVHKSFSFTESTQTINRYLVMLQSIGKKVECGNLYLPILCKVQTSDTICTDYKTLELYYQHYDVKIKNQIQARRRHRQKFAEEEIWYILYSLLNATRMFEKVGMSSGNLNTDSLVLNDKGHLKLVNLLTWPDSSTKPHKDRFYSPQELRAMRERIDKRINQNISETYSIAIIVLQLCTFIDGQNFYNKNNQTLNENMLQKAEQIVYRSYSKLLFNLLRTMLSNHYDRPLPSQIFAVFQPFQSYILKLQQFHFKLEKNSMSISNASLMSL